jgi:hypothetical protein
MNLTKQMAGLLGVAAGFSAMAAPQAPADGVMQFPNVSVDVARPPAERARAAPLHSGMTAYKDPATGRLTAPTPEQAAALAARTRRSASAAGPAMVKRSSYGGVSLALDARHERYATARKDADGAVADTCALHGVPGATVERTLSHAPGEHHEK